jgi:hypothetical protein
MIRGRTSRVNYLYLTGAFPNGSRIEKTDSVQEILRLGLPAGTPRRASTPFEGN